MRYLMVLVAMIVLSGFVSADTIVSTKGESYTKAADGQYYPSQYVQSNGSVLPASYFDKVQTQFQQLQRPYLSQPFVQQPQQFYYVSPFQFQNFGNYGSCPSCSGGNCKVR